MPSSTWSKAVQLNELQRNCAKIEIEVEFELNCRKCPKKNQRNQCKRFEDEIAENGIGNWSWVQIHSSTQHKLAGYGKMKECGRELSRTASVQIGLVMSCHNCGRSIDL